MRLYPSRIVCMTEESVEFLYKLGVQDKIVGISSYVERPKEAKEKKIVSSFLKANIKSIKKLNPDLILGFSDIQKDVARDLIGEGFNVWISNHRSLDEVLDYLLALGSLVGKREESLEIIKEYELKWKDIENSANQLSYKPRVYIEEWNDPMIGGIRYFSDVLTVCGGIDIFRNNSVGSLAKDRFVDPKDVLEADPEIILGCWCGKKVDLTDFGKREGWEKISAVKNDKIIELDPAVFLQPGPALFEDGLDQMFSIIKSYNEFREN